jgi:hypothetical protein
MIEDPIRLTNYWSWSEIINRNVQKLIFTISVDGKTLSLHFVANAAYPIPDVRKVFSIITVGHWTPFNIGTRYVNKEEFIEYLKENYPEHLEWVLFHQEWLC